MGTTSAAMRAKSVGKHGMPRVFQFQRRMLRRNAGGGGQRGRRGGRIFVRELRQRAIEFSGETRARENGIEFGDGLDRKTQRPEISAQALGQLIEDSRNLRRFVFGKLDEPVIVLDGFKRLDENGLPGRACGVDNALYLAPFSRAHGDDEAIVPQGDVILARIAAAGAQHALERFVNGLARVPHVGANSP